MTSQEPLACIFFSCGRPFIDNTAALAGPPAVHAPCVAGCPTPSLLSTIPTAACTGMAGTSSEGLAAAEHFIALDSQQECMPDVRRRLFAAAALQVAYDNSWDIDGPMLSGEIGAFKIAQLPMCQSPKIADIQHTAIKFGPFEAFDAIRREGGLQVVRILPTDCICLLWVTTSGNETATLLYIP
jgi:hypothetical protein